MGTSKGINRFLHDLFGEEMLEKLTAHKPPDQHELSIAEIGKALLEREKLAQEEAVASGAAAKEGDLGVGRGGLEESAADLMESVAADSEAFRVSLPDDHSQDSWGSLQDELDALLCKDDLSPQEEARIRELHDALEMALGAHDVDGAAMLSLIPQEQQQRFAELDAELTALYEKSSLTEEDEARMDVILQQMDALLTQS